MSDHSMQSGPEPIAESDLIAYIDGQLDARRHAEVERHLAAHAADAQRVADYRRIDEALRALHDDVAREPVPSRLLAAATRRLPGAWLGRVAHVAAAVCLLGAGAVGGWVVRDRQAPPPSAALVRQAAEAHRVYVVEVRHPVEVEASEEAHLVTWLSRRLGHPVKAPFLGDLGFTLVGGRLLPADGKPAAQFMYETLSGRRLTLFVRQLPGSAETAFRFTEDGGVRMFYWVDGPLGYALIGDVERDRLLSLARTVYTQLTP